MDTKKIVFASKEDFRRLYEKRNDDDKDSINNWLKFTKSQINLFKKMIDEANRLTSDNLSQYDFFYGTGSLNIDNLETGSMNFHKQWEKLYAIVDSLDYFLSHCNTKEERDTYHLYENYFTEISKAYTKLQKMEEARIYFLCGQVNKLEAMQMSSSTNANKEVTNSKVKALLQIIDKQRIANKRIYSFDVFTDLEPKVHCGSYNKLSQIIPFQKLNERVNARQKSGILPENDLSNIFKITLSYLKLQQDEIDSLIRRNISQYEFFGSWDKENGLKQFMNNLDYSLNYVVKIIKLTEYLKLKTNESILLNDIEEKLNSMTYMFEGMKKEIYMRSLYLMAQNDNLIDNYLNNNEFHKQYGKLINHVREFGSEHFEFNKFNRLTEHNKIYINKTLEDC